MIKTCTICLGKYTPHEQTKGIQVYCSKKCGKVGKSLVRKPRRKMEVSKSCKVCTTPFLAKYSNRIYCSKQCMKNTYKRKHKMCGNWNAAMERDRYKCRICSNTNVESLIVHHIDGTGEKESPNNTLDNLAVLCRSCHCKVHQLSFKVINGVIALDNPMYKLTGLLPIIFLDQVITPTMVPCEVR